MGFKNPQENIIETDVLVIGGGIGGPFAAIFASEGGARVALMEKAAVSRSGSAGMGIGGHHQLLSDKATVEDVADDICNGERKFIGTLGLLPIAKGLVNENLVYIGYRDNWETVRALEKWGLNMKWDNGQYRFLSVDNLRYHGRDIKKIIARKLKNSSVNVLERTMGIDLLTNKGAIAGATGLNMRTGQFVICKAKAIVLATGILSRIFNPWHQHSPGRFRMLYHYHAGSGDGIAMAFRAGAELINMEVSGIGATLEGCRLSDKIPLSHAPALPGFIFDTKGEKIEGRLSVELQREKERAGMGPCFTDVSTQTEGFHVELEGRTQDSYPIHLKFIKERGLDIRKDKFEIADYKPEHNSIIAGVIFDENARTNVKGLYAVGDMTGGSTFMGVANAAVFGMRAGKYVIEYVREVDQVDVEESQLNHQRDRIWASTKRKNGVEPLELEVKIRDIVERYCGPPRSKGKIDQGLWRLRSVRDKFLPEIVARDNHELMSAQEVRNLFLLAEIYLLSAREREESGMRMFRLDFPNKSNDPWNSANIAKLEEDEIKIYQKSMPQLKPEYRRE